MRAPASTPAQGRAAAAGPAALLVLLTLLVGCTGDTSSTPSTQSPVTPEGTPLADVATETLVVRRAPLCDQVDPAAVQRALGAEPAESREYASGQRVDLTDEVSDVAHEFGCAWTGDDPRISAGAWVFAPPVTAARARLLVRAARQEPRCTRLPDAAAYGAPSVALACRAPGGLEISHRGLFGDAWLTCTLAGPQEDRAAALDRAGRWCVAVAAAASGVSPPGS